MNRIPVRRGMTRSIAAGSYFAFQFHANFKSPRNLAVSRRLFSMQPAKARVEAVDVAEWFHIAATLKVSPLISRVTISNSMAPASRRFFPIRQAISRSDFPVTVKCWPGFKPLILWASENLLLIFQPHYQVFLICQSFFRSLDNYFLASAPSRWYKVGNERANIPSALAHTTPRFRLWVVDSGTPASCG